MQLLLDLLVGGDEAGGDITVIDDECGLQRRHGHDVAGRVGARQLRDLGWQLRERRIDVNHVLGLEGLDKAGELARRQCLEQHLRGRGTAGTTRVILAGTSTRRAGRVDEGRGHTGRWQQKT